MLEATARSTLATVMFVTLLSTAGIALPYPVLAPYFLSGTENGLVNFMGVHPKLLFGALLAIYPLGILFGSSFIGALSDHYGRKRTLVVSLCLAALGYLLAVVAIGLESFALFALARFLTGVCEGNDAVARAVALDLHPVINRTRSLTLVFAMAYGGWLVGPLAGGFLMPFGIAAVFGVAAAVTLLCALFVHFAMLETAKPGQHVPLRLSAIMRTDNSLHLWREPIIRPLLIFHLLYTLGLNAFYEFYPLWLVERFAFGSEQIAWSTVHITLAMIFTALFLVTRLRVRFSAEAIFSIGTLAFAALLVALVLTREPMLPLAFALIGIAIAFNSGSIPEFMAEQFASLGTGRVMGLVSTNFYAANVIIACVGSTISLLGSQWSLLAGAWLAALSTAWLLAYALPHLRRARSNTATA